jgi:hypothetical protein
MKPVFNQQVIQSKPLALQCFRSDSPRFVLYGCAILLVLRQAWIDGQQAKTPPVMPAKAGTHAWK